MFTHLVWGGGGGVTEVGGRCSVRLLASGFHSMISSFNLSPVYNYIYCFFSLLLI
jgi:hypothetical protein